MYEKDQSAGRDRRRYHRELAMIGDAIGARGASLADDLGLEFVGRRIGAGECEACAGRVGFERNGARLPMGR